MEISLKMSTNLFFVLLLFLANTMAIPDSHCESQSNCVTCVAVNCVYIANFQGSFCASPMDRSNAIMKTYTLSQCNRRYKGIC